MVTTALGVLLIAERAALLSGRDDEFVAVVLKGFTGMRWAELVGLETRYVRPHGIRIEWQLYELDTGVLHRCPPKDDSYRTIVVPGWLSRLVSEHLSEAKPEPCQCHELTYVFSGHRPPNHAPRIGAPTMMDVARRAGVSKATVSASLNRPEIVDENTRSLIAQAIEALGYVRGGWSASWLPTGGGQASPHGCSTRPATAGTPRRAA